MSDTKSIAGVQYKLCSPRGTLLGTITIPHDWAEILHERTQVGFIVSPEMPRAFSNYDNSTPIEASNACLIHSYAMEHALELWGISIEKFETLRDCSFAPSAAYLRSVIE